jgi:hypothetical protein
VLEAANGDEALIVLQKQDLQIDVLILAFVTDTYAMGYRFAAHFYERDADMKEIGRAALKLLTIAEMKPMST